MKKIKEFVLNNLKLLSILGVILLLSIIGITYALKIGPFTPIDVKINTADIFVIVSYDLSINDETITNNGNMLPISDELVTGKDVTDSRVLKVVFSVKGVSSNPENTIYDIALRNLNIDCDLLSKDFKWRLYKNNNLISHGNFSSDFDDMGDYFGNGRLVLTEIQQDLTTTEDTYTFLLWISESCTGDLSTCTPNQDQSKYLNKSFSADIKIELSTESKKPIVRTPGIMCAKEEIRE